MNNEEIHTKWAKLRDRLDQEIPNMDKLLLEKDGQPTVEFSVLASDDQATLLLVSMQGHISLFSQEEAHTLLQWLKGALQEE